MDPIYPRFAASDPVFYDRPRASPTDRTPRFAPSAHRDWSGWRNDIDDTWSSWRRPDAALPAQGWKLHISATPDTAAQVLAAATEYFADTGTPFKFVLDADLLEQLIGKEADRASAGKFVTSYPSSPDALEAMLDALEERIGGLAGPYILSDVRWRRGPLFVRYGAFVRRTFVRDGVEVHAVRNPITGELEEDVRAARFAPPPWVDIPMFLRDEIAAHADLTPPPDFPLVTGALHHSNAGGVYAADLGGRAVVLKEARPHSGYTPDGRDAVTRLAHEERVLRSLTGVPAPRVVGAYEALGHRFLALERVEGEALTAAIVQRHPLIRHAPSPAEIAAYRDWALTISDAVAAAVRALHAEGWSHGDLHPGNIVVRADGAVSLIDFEMSRRLDDPFASVIGAPGFVAPDGRIGTDADAYAFAAIALFVFLPLVPLLTLDRTKARQLIDAASLLFDLDDAWRARVGRQLVRDDGAARAPRIRSVTPSAIAQAIVDDATPDRIDRLWPGDPAQFAAAPYSLAHGATGVCLALHFAGHEVPSSALDWIAAAWQSRTAAPRWGLFDGAAGLAWGARQLGRHDIADDALALLADADLRALGHDLASGLAGVGLVLLADADRVDRVDERLDAIARDLGERWMRREPSSRVETGAGGLLRGGSGVALFALRLSERTGDPAHLRLMERCLEHDLAALLATPDGTLQINEGWRVLPYLGSGSAGVGSVLAQAMRLSPRLAEHGDRLAGIVRAASAPFVIQSGLLDGRAGLMQFLLLVDELGHGTADSAAALQRHLDQLSLHAIPRASGTAFAGNALLRVSHDLASGSAGVLTALANVAEARRGRTPPWFGIPFLTSPRAHGQLLRQRDEERG